MSLWDRLKGNLLGGKGTPTNTANSRRATLESRPSSSGKSQQANHVDPQTIDKFQIVWGTALQDTIFPSGLNIDPRYSYFTRQDEMAIRAAAVSVNIEHYHDAYLLFYPTTIFEEMMGGESQTPSVIIDLNQPEKGTIESRMRDGQTPAHRKLELPLLTQLPGSSPERAYRDGFAYGFNIEGLASAEFNTILTTLKYLKTIHHSHSVIYLVGRSNQQEGGIAFYWSNYRNLRDAYRRYNAPADTGAKQQRLR